MSEIDDIEKRVRSTICRTWAANRGITIEGRISESDFNTLLKAAGWTAPTPPPAPTGDH